MNTLKTTILSLLLFLSFSYQANAQTWSPMGGPHAYSFSGVTLFNNELVSATGNGGVRKWNGTSWEVLGDITSGTCTFIESADDKLIAIGDLTTSTASGNGFWVYDGTTWQLASDNSFFSNLYSLINYHDTIFTSCGAQSFDGNDCDNVVAYANDSFFYWNFIDAGSHGHSAMGIYNDALYATRSTGSSSSVPHVLVKYQNGVWSRVGTEALTDKKVYAIVSFQNHMYIGGKFTTINGNPITYIAKYDGTNWSSAGITSIDGDVRNLLVYNGNLYALGYFTTINGILTNGIAKYDGTTWSALSDMPNAVSYGQIGNVLNNNLYVCNSFTTNNSVEISGIGRWGDAATNLSTATDDDVKVFPNPANDFITISGVGVSTITLFDLSGNMVLTKSISSDNTIDISNLPKGFYILEAKSDQYIYTEKIIKK